MNSFTYLSNRPPFREEHVEFLGIQKYNKKLFHRQKFFDFFRFQALTEEVLWVIQLRSAHLHWVPVVLHYSARLFSGIYEKLLIETICLVAAVNLKS